MSVRIVPARDVPDVEGRWDAVTAGVWPEYNVHGNVMRRFWGRLLPELPDFQFAAVDEAGELLARGYSIPFRWDGTPEGLPDGIDGVLRDGFALTEAGGRPDALSALAIAVQPAHQRGGLSWRMLEHMRSLAREHGLQALVAPVRPVLKERYPLTPIERYASWRREDGLPFDPWIRTHERLGGEILRPEPRSLAIEAPVAEWEAWTGIPFPDTGAYVFPQGLAPLAVDREADVGRYWEPNVWMRHAAG